MRLGTSLTGAARRSFGALTATLALTSAGLIATGTAAYAEDTLVQVADRATGKCLDMKSYTIEPGAQVQRYPCNAGTNQHWVAALISGTSYNLVNEHSGLCLDVRGGSTQTGAEIQQYDCNGTSAQIWTRIPMLVDGSLWVTLRNRGSNLCVDSDEDTNLIVQRPCSTGTDSQLWRFIPVT